MIPVRRLMAAQVLDEVHGVLIAVGKLHPAHTADDLLVRLHRIVGLERSVPGEELVDEDA